MKSKSDTYGLGRLTRRSFFGACFSLVGLAASGEFVNVLLNQKADFRIVEWYTQSELARV